MQIKRDFAGSTDMWPTSAGGQVIEVANLTGFTVVEFYPAAGLDSHSGLQEVETPRLSRQSAHEGDKVVSPTHRPPLSPRRYRWTYCRRKNQVNQIPITPPKIEPRTSTDFAVAYPGK
jgi:hypothetical protein